MLMPELGLTYFDVIGLVVLFILFLCGISRGFLKELTGAITWIISLVGAKLLSYPVEGFMYDIMGIGNKLHENLSNIVSHVDFTSVEAVRKTLSIGLEKLDFVGNMLGDLVKSNWDITEIIQRGSANIQTELVNVLVKEIEPLLHHALGIACFVGLFIILFIGISIGFSVIRNIFTSVKLFGSADKLLGGILGLVKGCLFIIIMFSVLFVVFSLISSTNLSILMESRFFDIIIGIKTLIPG